MGGGLVRDKTLIAPSPNVSPIRLLACSHEEDLRQSACAVVGQLFTSEQFVKRIGGGSDLQPEIKRMKNAAYTVNVDSGREAMPTTPTFSSDKVTKSKWKLY